MKNQLQQLFGAGQSVWLDNLRRSMFASGELGRLIDQGLRGMTSNPTIFEKAIGAGSDYDDQLRGADRRCEKRGSAVLGARRLRTFHLPAVFAHGIWRDSKIVDDALFRFTIANATQPFSQCSIEIMPLGPSPFSVSLSRTLVRRGPA
ncbi:MAG: transaldolase family protein [Candidatus Tumulicola sp.]